MPELVWNEHEVIECLGVLPVSDEYKTEYYFEVANGGLRLKISLWPIESLLACSLFEKSGNTPVTSVWFVVRKHLIYVNDKRGSFLRFEDIVIVRPARGYYLYEGDVFDRSKFGQSVSLELHPDPLSLRFVPVQDH